MIRQEPNMVPLGWRKEINLLFVLKVTPGIVVDSGIMIWGCFGNLKKDRKDKAITKSILLAELNQFKSTLQSGCLLFLWNTQECFLCSSYEHTQCKLKENTHFI